MSPTSHAGDGKALIYEIDIGVGHLFSHPGASGARKIAKIWRHWVRRHILVQNYEGIGRECNFWSFGESCSNPIEAPNIEFLTLKMKIVHRMILNNQLAVAIEQLLALGVRLKEKIGGHWVRAIDFQ